ncbi:MAG: hypothetical protein IJK75_06160, partial [Bacteroidales bacterium]|nr:hypothetical protein [Bacteroidales bacterium]
WEHDTGCIQKGFLSSKKTLEELLENEATITDARINNIAKIDYLRDIIVNRYQDFFVLTTYCSTSVNLYQD